MKTFVLIALLLIILPCQYYWYMARKTLDVSLRKMDNDLAGRQDLVCLIAILLGYLGIYLFPYKMTLAAYLLAGTGIGIYIEIDYVKFLRKNKFNSQYSKKAVLFSALTCFATLTLGMALML
ncbi:hypothetical protein AQUSIP_07520 [Aquicella siphonis]|uniref:DUF4181 domain-containing protein n=1 Tax=Aquicella siphonis TaxID=254247 RepID=A0A5E4PG01_9COXI|nr:hypothetical protein [Aquicella siphonis]VVC75462.1 hypothetical protein AQUSIP_07520 [Aquicella siphonis]